MNKRSVLDKIEHLDFNGFRKLATDKSLTPHEKIGFLNQDRDGYTEYILSDIISKNPELNKSGKTILDIGSGCGELAFELINFCAEKENKLFLVDSKEMLEVLPNSQAIKVEGYFPNDMSEFISEQHNSIDVIIAYSIGHYVLVEGDIFNFIEQCLSMLKTNGTFFLADIPNLSKRNRFFQSEQGIDFHRSYTKNDSYPEMKGINLDDRRFDDGLVFGILTRYRNLGFETYLLPQSDELPMANRREDILIKKI